MQDNSRMKYITTIEAGDIYFYKPCFGRWYVKNLEPMKFRRWIRLFLEYVQGGFDVYYLIRDDKITGYILAADGGRRLKCTTKNDVVLGPYYVVESERGHNYVGKIRDAILPILTRKYEYAYSYIRNDNISSIKSTLRSGFSAYCRINVVGLRHRLVEDDNGDHTVYRKKL